MSRVQVLIAVSVMLLSVSAVAREAAGGENPPPFNVAATAVVLKNVRSGQHVCALNAQQPVAPASLTKLMTLYVAWDAVDSGFVSLADEVPISEKAWRTGGSRMFLDVKSRVPLEQLLRGIAVVSGNDACVAVAEHIAGAEEVFVERMNDRARELGMLATAFKNSHGLPAEGQHTTAADMALLALHYVQDHPRALTNHGIKEMTYNNISQRNRNGLLWIDSSVDGLKTGWFTEAGFHIIATAAQDDERYIAVVLGSGGERQRENTALQLLQYGFRNFQTIRAVEGALALAHMPVWKGAGPTVPLGLEQSVYITLPRESAGAVDLDMSLPDWLFAPVAAGAPIGTLTLAVDAAHVGRLPLVALNDVARAGVLKRTLHSAGLLFIFPPYWGVFFCAAVLIVVLLLRLITAKKKKPEHPGTGRM